MKEQKVTFSRMHYLPRKRSIWRIRKWQRSLESSNTKMRIWCHEVCGCLIIWSRGLATDRAIDGRREWGSCPSIWVWLRWAWNLFIRWCPTNSTSSHQSSWWRRSTESRQDWDNPNRNGALETATPLGTQALHQLLSNRGFSELDQRVLSFARLYLYWNYWRETST